MTFDELKQKVFEITQEEDYKNYRTKDNAIESFLRGYGGGDTSRIQHIEHEGGGEGGGEYCESVIKVDGVFYCVQYSYYSYEGFNYEDAEVTVVVPKEKLITVYEPA